MLDLEGSLRFSVGSLYFHQNGSIKKSCSSDERVLDNMYAVIIKIISDFFL